MDTKKKYKSLPNNLKHLNASGSMLTQSAPPGGCVLSLTVWARSNKLRKFHVKHSTSELLSTGNISCPFVLCYSRVMSVPGSRGLRHVVFNSYTACDFGSAREGILASGWNGCQTSRARKLGRYSLTVPVKKINKKKLKKRVGYHCASIRHPLTAWLSFHFCLWTSGREARSRPWP